MALLPAMDIKQCGVESRLWTHVKILHGCLLLGIAGSICGFWLCLNEIKTLRNNLDAEIAKRTFEFDDLESHSLDSIEEDRKRGVDNNNTNYFFEKLTDSRTTSSDDPLRFGDVGNEEKLTRFKRRARKKPAYYKDNTVDPKDMVWLTSYSRIPVSKSLILLNIVKYVRHKHILGQEIALHLSRQAIGSIMTCNLFYQSGTNETADWLNSLTG